MKTQIDLSNTIIETERLILRPFTINDVEDFFEYAKDKEVGPMAGWKPHKTMEDSIEVINLFLKNNDVLAIVLKENKKVIGSIGIHDSWANDTLEFKHLKAKKLGYTLSKMYWGHGLMPEATCAIIDYCFDVLNLELVTCEHFVTNHQSQRVIMKSGFSFYKISECYSSSLDKTFRTYNYIIKKPL